MMCLSVILEKMQNRGYVVYIPPLCHRVHNNQNFPLEFNHAKQVTINKNYSV